MKPKARFLIWVLLEMFLPWDHVIAAPPNSVVGMIYHEQIRMDAFGDYADRLIEFRDNGVFILLAYSSGGRGGPRYHVPFGSQVAGTYTYAVVGPDTARLSLIASEGQSLR